MMVKGQGIRSESGDGVYSSQSKLFIKNVSKLTRDHASGGGRKARWPEVGW